MLTVAAAVACGGNLGPFSAEVAGAPTITRMVAPPRAAAACALDTSSDQRARSLVAGDLDNLGVLVAEFADVGAAAGAAGARATLGTGALAVRPGFRLEFAEAFAEDRLLPFGLFSRGVPVAVVPFILESSLSVLPMSSSRSESTCHMRKVISQRPLGAIFRNVQSRRYLAPRL